MRKWLRNLLTSFQVDGVTDVRDLDTAIGRNYHATVRGNFRIGQVDSNVAMIGPRKLLALKVTRPEALRDLSEDNKKKIRRFLVSIDFIWDDNITVLEDNLVPGQRRPSSPTLASHSLGVYSPDQP